MPWHSTFMLRVGNQSRKSVEWICLFLAIDPPVGEVLFRAQMRGYAVHESRYDF